jgi:hypothetical protein
MSRIMAFFPGDEEASRKYLLSIYEQFKAVDAELFDRACLVVVKTMGQFRPEARLFYAAIKPLIGYTKVVLPDGDRMTGDQMRDARRAAIEADPSLKRVLGA